MKVYDDGPALGRCRIYRYCCKHDALHQCWVNAGPPSTTSGPHWPSIGSMPRVFWDCGDGDLRSGGALSTPSSAWLFPISRSCSLKKRWIWRGGGSEVRQRGYGFSWRGGGSTTTPLLTLTIPLRILSTSHITAFQLLISTAPPPPPHSTGRYTECPQGIRAVQSENLTNCKINPVKIVLEEFQKMSLVNVDVRAGLGTQRPFWAQKVLSATLTSGW